MVRKYDATTIQRETYKFDGEGSIEMHPLILGQQDLNYKGRAFAHTKILSSSSIGFHTHQGESEIFYILRGEGVFDDNGTQTPVSAGDVTFTPSGMGHGLRNTGQEPLEIIALILYT